MTSYEFDKLLTQLIEDKASFNSYVETELKTFFKKFREFLTQFQKPFKTGLFQKNPAKVMANVLKCASKIIGASCEKHYVSDMEPDISFCFLTLLHPKNSVEIRTSAIKMYFKMFCRLGQQALFFTSSFEKYIFDFAQIQDVCPQSKLSYELNDENRIQINDFPPRKPSNLIAHISYILDQIQKIDEDDLYTRWWEFLQRGLFSVLFKSVSDQTGFPSMGIGLVDSCPWDILKRLIDFITKLYQKSNLFFRILTIEHSPNYIFGIFNQCVTERIREPDAFALSLFFYQMVVNEKRILKYLHENYLPLLFQIMQSLQFVLDDFFKTTPHNNEHIQSTSDSIIMCFEKLFEVFENQQRFDLCSLLTNWTKYDNIPCRLHETTLILFLFVKQKVTDPYLWESVVLGGGKQRVLYLSVCAYFVSYYSVCLCNRILQFDLSTLGDSIRQTQPLDSWRDDHGIWLSQFSLLCDGKFKEFFGEYRKDLVPQENLKDNRIGEVCLPRLEFSNLNRDQCLTNVRAMLNAFDWRKFNNDPHQFKVYMIIESFIAPLLKIAKVFPPSVEYNYSFLLKEFFDWLMCCVCTKKDGADYLKIIHCSLKLIGEMVCSHYSIRFLDNRSLSNFFIALDNHMKCSDQAITQTALTYSCRSVLMGLNGSYILISSIVSVFNVISLDIADSSRLTNQEIVSVLLAIWSYCHISPKCSIRDHETEEWNLSIKISTIKQIHVVQPSLMIAVLIALLQEEIITNRSEIIEMMINLLSDSIKSLAIEDLYSFLPITLLLPELERTKSGSISKLLNSFLDSIETRASEDDVLYETKVALTTDLIIYSHYLIDIHPIYLRFESIVDSWLLDQKGCKFSPDVSQRLLYLTMYLASNFLRFPFPSTDYPSTIAKQPVSIFGSSVDHILRITNNQLISDLPIGSFTWNYSPVLPSPSIKELHSDVMINKNISLPNECESQKIFSNQIETFVTKTFDDHLPNLGIKAKKCSPSDYFHKNAPKLAPNNIPTPNPQFLPPSNPGTNATSFLTCFDFFDILETRRLYPMLQDREDRVRSFHQNGFRNRINVSFYSSNTVYPHFEDLKMGLGIGDSSTNNIIYYDCRHEIIFHTSKQQRKEIVIVWNCDLNNDQLMESYFKESSIRIEVSPKQSGLFSVKTWLSKSFDSSFLIKEAIVTKKALPVHILSQVLTNSYIINRKKSTISEPLKISGNAIRQMRSENFSFHELLLICAKNLLGTVSD